MGKKNKKVSLAKKPFLVLSRRAIAGWLVVIFFVCAWMFGIGVLVGRGTSPLKIDIDELQKKLQIARNELKKTAPAQIAKESDSAKDKPELEFYESLKKNGVDTEMPEVPPSLVKKPVTPAAPKIPAIPKKVSKKRLTKTGDEVAKKVTTSPKKPAEKSKPPSADKPYTIQVAAFKSGQDADNLVAELKQKGFSAYRAIGKVPGKGIWYRVRIGEFKNKAEAGSTIAKLKTAGKKPILVNK
jgi:cell division protein FtsN